MKRNASRAAGGVMLAGAACFVWYALGHPEAGFVWDVRITYALYAVYCAVAVLLLAAPWTKRG